MQATLELLYLRRNPFIRLLLPLICSILLSQFYQLDLGISLIINGCLLVGIIVVFTTKNWSLHRKTNPIFSALVFLTLFSVGTTLVAYKKQNSQQNYQAHLRKNSTFKGRISEPLVEKKNSYETIIEIEAIINDGIQLETYGKIKCYFAKEEREELPVIGDLILFQSYLNPVPAPLFPEEYNYKGYLQAQGITHTTFLPLHQFSVYGYQPTVYGYAQHLRNWLIGKFETGGLEQTELSVLSALFLGQKQTLSSEVKDDFVSAGAMHVLAVSGLHVGIILFILTLIFDLVLGKTKHLVLKTILILLLIWGFALLTGLSISVLRSSTMFSFLAIGKIIAKKSTTYNTIAASAFVLLIINPFSLFDVGFQLSYLALIGILYFYPFVYNWFYISNVYLNDLWSITAVSIAAQLITIPISIFYFNQIPMVSILANFFVIYMAIIIIGGALFSIVFIAITPVFNFFVAILNHIIAELVEIVSVIANIPNGNLTNLYISPLELFFIYAALLFFMLYQERKHFLYFQLSIAFISFFFIADHLENFQLKQTKKLFIYPTENELTINLITHDTNIVYTSDTTLVTIENLHRSLKNNWGTHDATVPIFNYLNANKNHRIIINKQAIFILNTAVDKIDPTLYDYILINNGYLSLDEIKNKITGRKYLIGSKINLLKTRELENQNRLLQLNLFNTTLLLLD